MRGFIRLKLRKMSLRPYLQSRSITGFTLVEIMVVVGIIVVLATLAIPNVMRARINSNEAAAVANLRSLYNVLQLYYMSNDNEYPSVLSSLIPPSSNPGYIDPELANGSKLGYLYSYNYIDEDSFYINANPRSPGKTGKRYFYIDEIGVVLGDSGGPADGDDDPVR